MDKYIIGMDMSPLSEVDMDGIHRIDLSNTLTIWLSDFLKALNGDMSPELESHMCGPTKEFYNLHIIGDVSLGFHYFDYYEKSLKNNYHFDCCRLANSRFVNCDLDVVFNHCLLSNVIFDHCKLYTSLFYQCNLFQVDFHTARMDDCCFMCNDIYGVMFPQGYHIPMTCPETGSFIGWKKGGDGEIICLEIPADAKRSSANGRKCRCDKAKVVSITDKDGNEKETANGWINPEFIYKVGEMVYSDKWDKNRWKECSNGIHFFMTRDEAVKYKIKLIR